MTEQQNITWLCSDDPAAYEYEIDGLTIYWTWEDPGFDGSDRRGVPCEPWESVNIVGFRIDEPFDVWDYLVTRCPLTYKDVKALCDALNYTEGHLRWKFTQDPKLAAMVVTGWVENQGRVSQSEVLQWIAESE